MKLTLLKIFIIEEFEVQLKLETSSAGPHCSFIRKATVKATGSDQTVRYFELEISMFITETGSEPEDQPRFSEHKQLIKN